MLHPGGSMIYSTTDGAAAIPMTRSTSAMHPLGTILIYAFPAVVAIAGLEAAILIFIRKRHYDWKASLTSLADAVTRQFVLRYLVPFSLAGPAIYWAAKYNIG